MTDPHTTPLAGSSAPRTTSRTEAPPASPRGWTDDDLRLGVARARDHLLRRQHPDGYWQGELQADASVTAGYVPIVYAVTGRIDADRARRAAAYVASQQLPDGSWPAYHGGDGNLDVSVQAYFGLKMAGVDASQGAMVKARSYILAHGGVDRTNLMTKLWLAVFGQVPYDAVPSVPPELMLLPDHGPFSIYDVASWSRETLVALMIVTALRPVFDVPEGAAIDELFAPGAVAAPLVRGGGGLGWPALFRLADGAARWWQRLPRPPMRGLALDRAEAWLLRHQESDGSWGGIMLPWMYALFALKALGYAEDHPVLARGIAGLETFIVEDDTTLRLQPATSPVWDTAWTVLALREAGLAPDDPALVRSARWLLEREIRKPGDWHVKQPQVEAAGWSFEFANDWYPDLDDTPVVARALGGLELPQALAARRDDAVRRALRWTLAMQCKDGGFAAFDVDNDRAFLAHAPFSDFVPPVDPSCADVTAHVLELLAALGEDGLARRRAIDFLVRTQEDDGAWYGRWGVNYLYGTGLALAALGAAGAERVADAVARGAAWLRSRQNDDGGWGETCRSYERPGQETRGRGPSTASQTGWALLGLTAAGGVPGADDAAVRRGVGFLLDSQSGDGDWAEEATTGTGFPGTFYLRYDLYRVTFPLMALARVAAGS